MILTEKIKEIVILNEMLIDEYESYEEAMKNNQIVYFEFNGHNIINPLYDESERNEVNPIEYYGKENINKFVNAIS